MFKKDTRTHLLIKKISIQRLHDITEDQAINEGVEFGKNPKLTSPLEPKYWKCYDTGIFCFDEARTSFITLWDSIYKKKQPWSRNPFVWVISFSIIDTQNRTGRTGMSWIAKQFENQ